MGPASENPRCTPPSKCHFCPRRPVFGSTYKVRCQEILPKWLGVPCFYSYPEIFFRELWGVGTRYFLFLFQKKTEMGTNKSPGDVFIPKYLLFYIKKNSWENILCSYPPPNSCFFSGGRSIFSIFNKILKEYNIYLESINKKTDNKIYCVPTPPQFYVFISG